MPKDFGPTRETAQEQEDGQNAIVRRRAIQQELLNEKMLEHYAQIQQGTVAAIPLQDHTIFTQVSEQKPQAPGREKEPLLKAQLTKAIKAIKDDADATQVLCA